MKDEVRKKRDLSAHCQRRKRTGQTAKGLSRSCARHLHQGTHLSRLLVLRSRLLRSRLLRTLGRRTDRRARVSVICSHASVLYALACMRPTLGYGSLLALRATSACRRQQAPADDNGLQAPANQLEQVLGTYVCMRLSASVYLRTANVSTRAHGHAQLQRMHGNDQTYRACEWTSGFPHLLVRRFQHLQRPAKHLDLARRWMHPTMNALDARRHFVCAT